jgi:hypothetical protein
VTLEILLEPTESRRKLRERDPHRLHVSEDTPPIPRGMVTWADR